MININALGKRYGPKVLFSNVTLQLNPRERYGLVGANGSGKSTFLKILMGFEGSDDGQFNFGKSVRLGFLRQDQFSDEKARIIDVAMQGDRAVFDALTELDRIAHGEDVDPYAVTELTELIGREDGYTLEARAREILVGVGIPSDKLDLPMGTLSGGYRLRVLLAQVLAGRPDVLLLDEPTNHLDILSIRWLEGFLRDYAGCAVVISHDRRFLDSITTRMLDVDYETITDYSGNYTAFLRQKEEARTLKEAQVERAERIIAEKRAFVDRFGAKATKAKQAQSRLKQIEKIEVEEVARTSRRAPYFRFDQERATGKDVLKVEGVTKSYGDKRVLTDVEFKVRRGERVALIGANGIGKSTLLKIVTDHLKADGGTFEWGANAKLGYFAQDHHELLNDPKLTPLDFVWSAAPAEGTSVIRGQLGRMLFSGNEVEKKVTTLSGGEAARVIFARLTIEKPNVLVLDEPTNHLDIEAIDALAAALKVYEGTLIFVSHDRWFVSELATRVIELKADGLHDFDGTYEEYLARDGDDHLSGEAASLKAKREAAAAKETAPKIDFREQRKLTNRLKTLPAKRDELLEKIDELEAEKAAIHERYAEPDFFTDTPAADQEKVRAREARVDQLIGETLNAWEATEAEIVELTEVLGTSA